VTIPRDTKIVLVSLQNVSSETAIAGSSVRFAVANDVVVNGVTVLHAGAPVSGMITEAKRGFAHHRWASLTIRVKGIQIGRNAKLCLTRSDPGSRLKAGKFFREYGACIFVLLGCVALAILSAEGCGEDGCAKAKDSNGEQALLPSCVSEDFWVKSSVAFSSTMVAEENAAASAYPGITCDQIVERSKIFGQPGISYVEIK
jgi:hypothetical protein